ncbi:MAG: hypothetical protein A4E28_02006 [Methanocella sp. PtaU1.Bin125]|nr:MAG: hypothetical protein A4E28_02006 [Methanocella sp. PtaU1.Bin125]
MKRSTAGKGPGRYADARGEGAGTDLHGSVSDRDIYLRAIDRLGRESQADAVIEEAAELIFAIIKHKRAAAAGAFAGERLDAVIEEIADMQIALDQAKLIYCGTSPDAAAAFEDVRQRKLAKLAARLEMD